MDEIIKQALAQDRTIDITTIGRKTGQPRRIEIWFHHVNDRYYITGSPGRRSWYANLVANPKFTFHLKESVQADLPARARAITDEVERRQVLPDILEHVNVDKSALGDWVKRSPLVEITFSDR